MPCRELQSQESNLTQSSNKNIGAASTPTATKLLKKEAHGWKDAEEYSE